MPAWLDRALSPLVLVVGGLLIELAWALVSRDANPDRLNGINGLVGVGVPVLIALRSVAAATVVALGGSVLFVVLVNYAEGSDPIAYGVPVVVAWTGLAVAVGLTARALRTRARHATDEASSCTARCSPRWCRARRCGAPTCASAWPSSPARRAWSSAATSSTSSRPPITGSLR
jgi:hypothetical protein